MGEQWVYMFHVRHVVHVTLASASKTVVVFYLVIISDATCEFSMEMKKNIELN